MILQRQLLGTQYAEDRRSVCGRNHRADQKAGQPVKTKDSVDKDTYQSSCQYDTNGGKQKSRRSDRARSLKIGAESAVKHNKHQTGGADGLRKAVVVKRNPQKPVHAKAHTQQKEKDQGGDRDLIGKTVHKKAQNDNNARKQ